MIREFLEKKAAARIRGSRHARGLAGRITTAVLDPESLDISAHQAAIHAERRLIVYAATANLVSWISVLLLPKLVGYLVIALSLLFSKGAILLVMPALGFTVFGVYAALRTIFPERIERNAADAPILNAFERDSESLLTWKLWLVACGAGGLNAMLLIAVYLYNSGDWAYHSR